MHSYLRAIGFSHCRTRKQLEDVYLRTLKTPNRKIITTISVDTSLIQLEKDFAPGMGIALIGECDINGSLSIEHYYPYVKGEQFMEFEYISIEKQTDKESYAGVCEDYRMGMSLIFYLQNIADYAKSKWLNYSNRNFSQVKFSALSTNGTVLLGVRRTDKDRLHERHQRHRKNDLLAAAKDGDPKAMEQLTYNEMDVYSAITSRMRNEDILSVVDTSLMPCGVECDHYVAIGTILKVSEFTNEMSNEVVYNLLIDANDIIMNVAINQADLQGEPKEGRRFRGEVWIQGIVRI